MRSDDINALLAGCSSALPDFQQQVGAGKIDAVKLKNTLENLRSVLDYLAHDVQDRLKTISPKEIHRDKVYFPYGQRQNHFKRSVQRNLPTLQRDLPGVYQAIFDAQPFVSGNNWIVDLCELTNEAKHRQLHKTESHLAVRVDAGPLGTFSTQNFVMENNYINGRRVDDFVVQDGKVQTHFKHAVDVVITPNNKIMLPGKQLDVMQFLNNATVGVRLLVDEVIAEL